MLNAKFFEIFDGNALTKVSPKNLKTSLKQLHQLMQNCAKWKNVEQKNTHISGYKIVHLYTIVTVSVHICTITVALAFIILLVFSLSFSLSL